MRLSSIKVGTRENAGTAKDIIFYLSVIIRAQTETSRKVLKVAQWKDANGSWKFDVSNSFVLGQTMYDDWLMTDWWLTDDWLMTYWWLTECVMLCGDVVWWCCVWCWCKWWCWMIDFMLFGGFGNGWMREWTLVVVESLMRLKSTLLISKKLQETLVA